MKITRRQLRQIIKEESFADVERARNAERAEAEFMARVEDDVEELS
jgi:hypothetical protein